MAERRPTTRAPIFGEAGIGHEGLETRALADGYVTRMPEPGGGNRLVIAGTNFILVEFERALRRADMHVGKAEISELRQGFGCGGARRRRFKNLRRGLRHA